MRGAHNCSGPPVSEMTCISGPLIISLMWNSLPTAVRNSSTLSNFKYALKSHLFRPTWLFSRLHQQLRSVTAPLNRFYAIEIIVVLLLLLLLYTYIHTYIYTYMYVCVCVCVCVCTKFDWNRINHGWDILIKPFTKWRLSAILKLLWRHHIASENCILCSLLCVKFSRRLVAYFLKYLVFHVSAFWLEIAYFRLILTIFGEKCENAKIIYSNSNSQKAHPWRRTRLLSVER